MFVPLYLLDAPISKALQQNFMDYLLSTYRELERSFMRNLYELHKAFAFRTLWEGNNPLVSFQRVASESALETGRLNGAIQLTEVLQKMKRMKYKAVSCFTNHIYTTSIMKWSFHNAKDKAVRVKLAYSSFSHWSHLTTNTNFFSLLLSDHNRFLLFSS